jgi:hypothetical protein
LGGQGGQCGQGTFELQNFCARKIWLVGSLSSDASSAFPELSIYTLTTLTTLTDVDKYRAFSGQGIWSEMEGTLSTLTTPFRWN